MTFPKYAYVKWLRRRRWHRRRRGKQGRNWPKDRTKPKRLKHIDNKLTMGQKGGVGGGGAFSIKYDGKRWAPFVTSVIIDHVQGWVGDGSNS